MILKLLFLSLCVIFHSNNFVANCAFVKTSTPMCFSIQDVHEAANGLWEDLQIINIERKPFYDVLPWNCFSKYLNLRKLGIKGMVNKIDRGAFYGLKKLEELNIELNNLEGYTADIFSYLKVDRLLLRKNNLKVLLPNVFQGIIQLKQISIEEDYIYHIPNQVFNNLSIKKLDLNKNGIHRIDPGAFFGMDELQHLSLNNNNLNAFDVKEIIGTSTTLKYLYLNNNKLTSINSTTFKGLPSLYCLYLANNQIEIIEDQAFLFENLKDLSLTGNRLKEFQANIFKSHPISLEILNFSYNNLTFLSFDLLSNMPNLTEIYAVGNPWQCGCLYKLEEWIVAHGIVEHRCEFSETGQYPVCIQHNANSTECVDNLISDQNSAMDYYDGLYKYTSLPDCLNVRLYEIQ